MSIEEGIKRESFVGADRLWELLQRVGGSDSAGRRGRTAKAVILDYTNDIYVL